MRWSVSKERRMLMEQEIAMHMCERGGDMHTCERKN
jgi:hypothetical protein